MTSDNKVVTQTPLVAEEVSPEAQEAANILEQLEAAVKAPEPSGMETVINKGSEENPAPARLSSLTSAGYVYIWDNVTGERSVTNRNMLPTQLKKKRPDGSRVFVVKDPGISVKRGFMKCLLHSKGPNRKEWDKLGLAVCDKENLPSGYQILQHMKHRHKEEWALIEKERVDKEKAEAREQQLAMTEAMQAIAKGQNKKEK